MSLSTGSPAGAAASNSDVIRVMVVDDSAVIRGLLTKALEQDPEIDVVASVSNGQMAVNTVSRQDIDVVVLDIEMPVMDGLTALPLILKASPKTKVVMASTLTRRGADITLKAMSAGAADYLPKPTATREIHGADAFRQELLAKVKALGRAVRPAGKRATPGADRGADRIVDRAGHRSAPQQSATRGADATRTQPRPGDSPVLRPVPRGFRPGIIAIASSTGGPQALFEVIAHLSPNRGGAVQAPIVVTQHMPATFTTILAEHICRQCDIEAVEATDGDALKPGRVYIAPGQYHMVVTGPATAPVVRINQDPPENFCRPSADPMLRSVARLYSGRSLAVVLTGMGHDGLNGCRQIVEAGGVVVAQDEQTSVVWGMPGAVTNAGLSSEVLPLTKVGPCIRRMLVN